MQNFWPLIFETPKRAFFTMDCVELLTKSSVKVFRLSNRKVKPNVYFYRFAFHQNKCIVSGPNISKP